jgi:hypothetical protein
MKNKMQGDQSPNDTANHFWEKPIGKIVISVIAGTIVVFIGIGINRSCAPKPQISTKNSEQDKKVIPFSQDTPGKIISEIEAAPPLQREDIAKAYIGIPVNWELFFIYGTPVNKDKFSLMFSPTYIRTGVYVNCSVSKDSNAYLRRITVNTKLRVQGTIDSISNGSIFLNNAKVTQLQEQ